MMNGASYIFEAIAIDEAKKLNASCSGEISAKERKGEMLLLTIIMRYVFCSLAFWYKFTQWTNSGFPKPSRIWIILQTKKGLEKSK